MWSELIGNGFFCCCKIMHYYNFLLAKNCFLQFEYPQGLDICVQLERRYVCRYLRIDIPYEYKDTSNLAMTSFFKYLDYY